jgi:hypothetical protein
MSRTIIAVFALSFAVLTSCGPGLDTERSEWSSGTPAEASLALLEDSGHSAPEGFYFLPPIATDSVPAGALDVSLRPTVQVLQMDSAGAQELGVLATFTTSGSGSERVRVGSDGYIVNWHSGRSGVAEGGRYRVVVLLDERRLGSADVLASRGGGREPGVVRIAPGATLPIKFWLNRCAPVVCTALDACHDVGRCSPDTAMCSQPLKPACEQCLAAPNCELNAENVPQYRATEEPILGSSLTIPPDAAAVMDITGRYDVAVGESFPHEPVPVDDGSVDYQLTTVGHLIRFDEAGGPGFTFPAGTCATMVVPYFPEGLLQGLEPATTLRLYQLEDGVLLRVPGEQHVDVAARTVSACVTHLSEYVVAQSGPARGAYEPASLWNTREIPVCWESLDPAFGVDREWVRDQIARTWEANSALSFTGWGACSPGARGIRIGVEDRPLTAEEIAAGDLNGNAPSSYVGTSVDGRPSGMTMNFTYQNWSTASCQNTRERCTRIIAVHEFGHALGFDHEQNRADSSCPRDKHASEARGVYGEFDASSVMNYCNPSWSGNGLLSPTDIGLVRALYGAPPGADLLYALRIEQPGGLFGARADLSFGEAECRLGATRTECVVATKSPGGNCYVVGWADPDNPADCRCTIHVGVPSLSSVSCIAEIHGALPAPTCGGSGQACCDGATCNNGLVCDNGTCTATIPTCGSLNQRCCTGSTCDGGLACVANFCLPVSPEVCNGVDDDRNGQVDDGLVCHTIAFIAENVDDEVFLWVDRPTTVEAAICEAHRSSGGSVRCELSSAGLPHAATAVPYTLMLGNGGCFNTRGDFYLEIDGTAHHLSSQGDTPLVHCGWTHRQHFTVDFVNGTYTAFDSDIDACVLPTDCML